MARVVFSSFVEEITGKLAGSVFQDSYAGFQIRSRVQPRNPRSYYQQLRRGEFAYLRTGFRYLSPEARSTWGYTSTRRVSSIEHYTANNVNLSLVGIPPVATYENQVTVPDVTVEVQYFTAETLIIRLVGSTTTVPAGFRLLVYATPERETQQIFSNPSMFSPIEVFPFDYDLAGGAEVMPAWRARFGQPKGDMRVCVKALLINVQNGDRGNESIACANAEPVLTYFIVNANGDRLIDANGDFVVSQ